MSNLIGVEATAHRLGLSVWTVYRWARDGRSEKHSARAPPAIYRGRPPRVDRGESKRLNSQRQRTPSEVIPRATVNDHLLFLISDVYNNRLAAEHLADLKASGLTEATIALHRIRTVPPSMIARLLGFDVPAVQSAMLIPFPDPAGGFLDHVRMKVFPPLKSMECSPFFCSPRGA